MLHALCFNNKNKWSLCFKTAKQKIKILFLDVFYWCIVVFYIGSFNMEKLIIFSIIDNIIEYYRYVDYYIYFINCGKD